MIVLIGLAGGLLTGFGVLFLTVTPVQPAVTQHAAPGHPAVHTPPRQPACGPIEPFVQQSGKLSLKQSLSKVSNGRLSRNIQGQ